MLALLPDPVQQQYVRVRLMTWEEAMYHARILAGVSGYRMRVQRARWMDHGPWVWEIVRVFPWERWGRR